MAKKLNWEKAVLARKPSLSVKTEIEFLDRDLATRWLEKAERWEERKRKLLKAKKRKSK